MVLGLSYLFFFNGSSLKGTFLSLSHVILSIFYNTLFNGEKFIAEDGSYLEVTAELLKDSWLKPWYESFYRMLGQRFIKCLAIIFKCDGHGQWCYFPCQHKDNACIDTDKRASAFRKVHRYFCTIDIYFMYKPHCEIRL